MKIKELDSVALLHDQPAYALKKGDVGVVVEILDEDTVEVEFTDNKGKTIALLPLTEKDFIRLNLKPSLV